MWESYSLKDSDMRKIIKGKDTILNAPKDIANSFNTFFCLVAPNIQLKINFAHKSFNHFLKNPCNESIFIKPCTNEIIISDLSSNKATGPNNIPIKIMKLAKNCFANNLSVLFNLSFSSGVLPDKLKIAKIFSVFKKGPKLECSNYRPISLLPKRDKIYEKLMHKRLMEFLNDQKILNCSRFLNCSCYN